MNSRLEELERSKHVLLSRAASERDELVRICRRLGFREAFVDFGLRLIGLVKAHPVLAATLGSLFVRSRLIRVPVWALALLRILSSATRPKTAG